MATAPPETTHELPAWPGGPFSLNQVVGHQTVRQWLQSSLERNQLPHALLLVGPRGVGKRTLIRALVAQTFCQHGAGCGACGDCLATLAGRQSGFHEVLLEGDKRFLSIAQIKGLSQKLALRAPHEKGRITLIAQADRMTPDAQDAFLKTLEEPAANNWLMLTADRLDSILPTIRSRCQRLTLHRLSDQELAEVGRRQGFGPETPWFLAMGCPGRLAALADPALEELRKGLFWLLKNDRPGLSHWTYVLLRGLPEKPESFRVAERALLLLQLCHSFVRDLTALSADPDTAKIQNGDFVDELRSLSQLQRWNSPGQLLQRIATVRRWIEGSVDPGTALTSLLTPVERSLQHLSHNMEAEVLGL